MTWKGLGPLSYKGQGRPRTSALPSITLTVQKTSLQDAPSSIHAQINPSDVQQIWQEYEQPIFSELESGSDCVVTIKLNENIDQGKILLSEEQMYNWRVVEGQPVEIKPFMPGQVEKPFDLIEIDVEIRLKDRCQSTNQDENENEQNKQEIIVDSKQFCGQFLKRFFNQVIAVNQIAVINYENNDFILRVSETNSLTYAEREESLTYHCYRGQVTADTKMFITVQNISKNNQKITINSNDVDRTQRQQQSWNVVDVFTSDDEWFPVNKRLLRPCIKLTEAVRKEGPAEVKIVVDSLNFDRVLRYLESTQSKLREAPNFPGHVLEDLLEAANQLGLRPLEQSIETKMGKLQSRLKVFRLSEVNERNARGECLLLMDGMVLDVTRWLPEHPGGNTIIPEQALDIDSCRFFELYHATRESFLYLKEFYVGELDPLDRDSVPCQQQASEEFMEQLREYTSFRMVVELDEKPWKSF
eukprot:TRINITY_DN16897_c0_g1_i3.p1 TRINITY_DN16897_c0_g1~~TRINITY_DN16897_c0_g1_i3.p1  ORF type:complete len:522 (-),score=46.07 TRINITY_DN16897_c0_g1_i3:231-1643(-)